MAQLVCLELLVLVVCAGVCLAVAGGVELAGCNRRIFLERRRNVITFDVDEVSMSTYTLTLATDSGSTVPLATCNGSQLCSPSQDAEMRYPGLQVGQPHPGVVILQHYNLTDSFAGTLTCTRSSGDTVQSASAHISVSRVARQGSWEVEEDHPATLTAATSTFRNSTLTWTLTTDEGGIQPLGTCDDVGNCTSPLSPDINVTRVLRTSASVDFGSVQRNHIGNLSCSFFYQGSTDTHSQPLLVYHPATLDNCRVDVIHHNRSLLLSCDVTEVFSSGGRYEFQIYEEFQLMKGSHVVPANEFVPPIPQSFADSLSPYTNDSNNREYYRGRLTHSWPMTQLQGKYTRFHVYVFPGTGTHKGSATIHQEIPVSAPDQVSDESRGKWIGAGAGAGGGGVLVIVIIVVVIIFCLRRGKLGSRSSTGGQENLAMRDR